MIRQAFNFHTIAVWLVANVTPVILVLFMLLLGGLPQVLPTPQQAAIGLGLATMCYWSLLNPHGFGWGKLVLLALFADGFYAQPCGTSLIIWSICLNAMHQQRRFLLSQRLITIWVMFACLLFFALQLSWILTGLFSQSWGQWWLWLPTWLWQIALLPIIMLITDACQKNIQSWQLTP